VCRDLIQQLQRFFDMLPGAPQSPACEWLTVDQVSQELKLSKSIVYQLIRNGELEAINVVSNQGKRRQRGHYRVSRDKLNEYIEGKKIAPASETHHPARRERKYPKVKNYLGL
jgi:excisionase family DNA binding protein